MFIDDFKADDEFDIFNENFEITNMIWIKLKHQIYKIFQRDFLKYVYGYDK